VFDAFTHARAAQDEATRDDYLLGLVRGRGNKALVADLIKEGTERLGNHSEPYRQAIVDFLQAAAARTSPMGPRWHGLNRRRISLADNGQEKWEVGRTPAQDDVGCG
jgi:hypothetical protein